MSIVQITTTHLHHDSGARFYIVHCYKPDASLHLMGSGEHTELGLKEGQIYSASKKEDILYMIGERERVMDKCGYRQMSHEHQDLDLEVAKDINCFISHYEKLLGLRRTRELLDRLQKASVKAQDNYVIKTAQQGVW